MRQEARCQTRGQIINYSSLIFFCSLFLVYYLPNSSHPSISLLHLFNLNMDCWSVICNSEGTAGVCGIEGEEAWSDAIFEAYSIPVWIRHLWMRAQRMHTNKTVWVTYLHMWRRKHAWDTLLVNSLTLPSNEYFIQPRVRKKESERDERLQEES